MAAQYLLASSLRRVCSIGGRCSDVIDPASAGWLSGPADTEGSDFPAFAGEGMLKTDGLLLQNYTLIA